VREWAGGLVDEQSSSEVGEKWYCKRVKQEVQDGSMKDEAGTLKLLWTRQTRY